MRRYNKNFTGISISKGYGRIDISHKLIEYLGYPSHLTFMKVNDDWMRVYPNVVVEEGVDTASIDYLPNKSGTYRFFINDKKLVRKIFADYDIFRWNDAEFSPFFMIDYHRINEMPYVEICMNHFSDYLGG